ncbi:BhlA/UviB family holin-like peptide [Weizmannia sp. CD-2023]|uniref:BhlA/UviB family holin-like peptide n=1 Tax=Heyndrickxia TaxID=2837504 RepID=UPI002E1B9A6E|nr:BhlA/UviB family holin-like peptide [Weizmannia sp. CD-2023]MED4899760.1 BhlA/UviB family holin-like peptide [Weizmannia sp. CD-2023]
MEQILLQLASKEGLFAVMFVVLFVYQILDSRRREERLMSFIDDITKQFELLATQYEKLAEDVNDIKDNLLNDKSH